MITIATKLSGTLLLLPGPKLRHGKYGKHVTFIPSRKNGRIVGCETFLEADFCLELERLPMITAYESQPFTLVLTKSRKRYTPDFAAKFLDNRIVVYEVKADSMITDTSTRARLNYLKDLLAQCGYPLECIYEHQIRHPIRNHNLRVLYHQSLGSDLKKALHLRTLIQESPQQELTVHTLLEAGERPQDLAYAVFHGLVLANLNRPFSACTQLHCRGGHG